LDDKLLFSEGKLSYGKIQFKGKPHKRYFIAIEDGNGQFVDFKIEQLDINQIENEKLKG